MLLFDSWKRLPVVPCCLQKPETSEHVGLDEVFGAMDGAIHMRFGSEIDDGTRPVFSQELRHQRTVANIALHEHMARVALDTLARLQQVARIGELVEIDNALRGAAQPVEYEIGADEAGAAR